VHHSIELLVPDSAQIRHARVDAVDFFLIGVDPR